MTNQATGKSNLLNLGGAKKVFKKNTPPLQSSGFIVSTVSGHSSLVYGTTDDAVEVLNLTFGNDLVWLSLIRRRNINIDPYHFLAAPRLL